MAENIDQAEKVGNEGNGGALKGWLIKVGILVVVFLLGLVPMWISKRSVVNELDKSKRGLRRCQIESTLAGAEIFARRGEYETARQSASSFFTDLQAELDRSEPSRFSAEERSQMPPLLSGRDEIITLLSRNDPAAAERLSNLYVAYRAATAGATPSQ